jgi:IS5 family transposase
MHSVAKGKQWFFGMRCHIGVDATSGLVHSVENTAANVHERNTAADRLHGDERLIYGDAGHIGIEKRDDFQDLPDVNYVGGRVDSCALLPI